MKINCKIVRDLMPSYIDRICSEESNKLIEEHILECNECKEYLDNIRKEISTHKIDEKDTLKNFYKKIKSKNKMAIFISIVITLLFVILGYIIVNFNKEDFIMKYEEKLITVEEQKEGEIVASVNTLNYTRCQVILEENYDGTVDVYIALFQSLRDKIYTKEEFKTFGYVPKCYKNYIDENMDVNWIWENNIGKIKLNTKNGVEISKIYYLDTNEKFDIILKSNETSGEAFEMQEIWSK